MADFIFWPRDVLRPANIALTQSPFTRSGGRTLGGIERAVSTDLGYWRINLQNVLLHSRAQRRTWNAIRSKLGGRTGIIAVPAWSFDSAPYASGAVEAPHLLDHSDGSPFSDDSTYYQGAIAVTMSTAAALGATSVTLNAVNASNLSGIRFSHQHALYETGPATSISGNLWTVPVFPALRQAIPAGASLECDNPTCLVHMAEDAGMDGPLNSTLVDTASVNFVEACDYWTDLALAG